MKDLMVVVMAASMIGGCATDGRIRSDSAATFSVQEIVDGSKGLGDLQRENDEVIEKAMLEVLSFCQPRLSGFEAAAARQSKLAYWLSMSGLIAGSVVAPGLVAANATANATWVAGLSGWAGATNFAGQALRTSGLSGSTNAETRNAIVAKVGAAIEIASDGTKDFATRRGALMRARAQCTLYEIAVPSLPQQ